MQANVNRRVSNMLNVPTMDPNLDDLETPGYVFLSSKILMFTTVIFVDLAMGSSLQPHDIRRQWNTLGGVLVGALMQYIIFPTMAFAVCHILAVPGPFSIGVALVAACPGSTFSALLTYYINGDVCLSLCITAVNSAVSIGFATAMLHLYSRSWTHRTLHFALWPLAWLLCLHVLMPIAGYLIRKFSEKMALIVEAIGTVIGLLSYLADCLIELVGTPWGILRASWANVSIAVFLLPALGWVSAYFLALLLRQNVWRRRSICAEILLHSVPLALVILATTFHNFEYRQEMAAVLALFNPVTGIYGLVALVVYNLRPPWTTSGSEGLARTGELRDMAENQNDERSVSGDSSGGEVMEASTLENKQDQTKSAAMASDSSEIPHGSRPSAILLIEAASKWKQGRKSTGSTSPMPSVQCPMRVSMV